MTVLIGNHCGTAAEVVAGLRLSNFPLEPLISHPVSAIENIAETTSRIRTVCGVGCLACCTNSVMPMRSKGEINLLTPQMLSSVLKVAEHLALEGVHLLSTDRLNLFSGSNELDHPFCIALRELVSAFFERTYGRRLGSISSDIVFHVSTAELFHTHLAAIVARPTLWDNICFSIDEQIPFASRVPHSKRNMLYCTREDRSARRALNNSLSGM